MEALKDLTSNMPQWRRKLDLLTGEIDKRQLELAEGYRQNEQGTQAALTATARLYRVSKAPG